MNSVAAHSPLPVDFFFPSLPRAFTCCAVFRVFSPPFAGRVTFSLRLVLSSPPSEFGANLLHFVFPPGFWDEDHPAFQAATSPFVLYSFPRPATSILNARHQPKRLDFLHLSCLFRSFPGEPEIGSSWCSPSPGFRESLTSSHFCSAPPVSAMWFQVSPPACYRTFSLTRRV